MSSPHLSTRIYRLNIDCFLETYSRRASDWDWWLGLAVLNIPCEPKSLEILTDDGAKIGGFQWRHKAFSHEPRSVVIINTATSVRCRYFGRFAEFSLSRGFRCADL